MSFPSSHPSHSRRSVVNVDKFSGTNLSGPHPGKFGIYPSEVGGPLSTISLPLRHLPFHLTALSTLLPRLRTSGDGDGFTVASFAYCPLQAGRLRGNLRMRLGHGFAQRVSSRFSLEPL